MLPHLGEPLKTPKIDFWNTGVYRASNIAGSIIYYKHWKSERSLSDFAAATAVQIRCVSRAIITFWICALFANSCLPNYLIGALTLLILLKEVYMPLKLLQLF